LNVRVDLRGVDELRTREDQVRASNLMYDEIIFDVAGAISAIPSRSPSIPPLYSPSLNPTASPLNSKPTLSPSTSEPSKAPSPKPSRNPTQDIYKFNLIWIPDASVGICDGTPVESQEDEGCPNYYHQIEFMQNVTRELSAQYTDVSLFPYDLRARIAFDQGMNSTEQYVNAIPENYFLLNPEEPVSYVTAFPDVIDFIIDESGDWNTPISTRNSDENYLAIMTISEPISDAKIDVYIHFWLPLKIDMVVICMNKKGCDQIDQQFRHYSGFNNLIYKVDSPGDVNVNDFVQMIKDSNLQPLPRLDP